MTAPHRRWSVTVQMADGTEVEMSIRAAGGAVVFASSKFLFTATPDEADVMSPSVQAAANAARQQTGRP